MSAVTDCYLAISLLSDVWSGKVDFKENKWIDQRNSGFLLVVLV
jgi:hypothetical protein